MERLFDACIVILGALSEPMVKRIIQHYKLSLDEDWILVCACGLALTIFLCGWMIERLLGSARWFRLFILQDRRSALMGTWIKQCSKTNTDPPWIYVCCRLGYDANAEEYTFAGVSYLADGTPHSRFTSLGGLVFPDPDAPEIRYQYRSTLFSNPKDNHEPRALYGTTYIFFDTNDRGNGWFWDEDKVAGAQTHLSVVRLTSSLLTSIGIPKVRPSQVMERSKLTEEMVLQLHKNRAAIFKDSPSPSLSSVGLVAIPQQSQASSE